MPEPRSTPLRRTMRVLVVEDETRYREFLVGTLTEMGCEAIGLPNAVEALARFDGLAPDAMLLDLNLPRLDGLTFLDRLRPRAPDLPVVILTGVGDLPTAQEAIRLGVVDFLTKPCHLGEIERAIERCARRVAQRTAGEPKPSNETPRRPPGGTISELEREAILAALERHNGNRSAAAADLGISRRTLYNRIERYRQQRRWPKVSKPAAPTGPRPTSPAPAATPSCATRSLR